MYQQVDFHLHLYINNSFVGLSKGILDYLTLKKSNIDFKFALQTRK